MNHRSLVPVLLVAATLTAAGCGSQTGSSGSSGSAAGSTYPVSVDNCGSSVTFDEEPDRAVLLKSSSVPYLHDIGVLDRVVAKAGEYPAAYYDSATRQELDAIPSLTGKTDASGHLMISKEVVIAERPDLVLGEVDNLSRDTLAPVGIPLLEEPALCQQGAPDHVDFDDVYSQLTQYGKVFDRPDQAAAAVSALKKRTAAIEEKSGSVADGRTAAFLYPTVGGGITYAYGKRSMTDAVLKAAGFKNVFGDVDERVFEVSNEQLLARNPDVIVMLYSDGDPAAVEKAVTDLPGAAKLTAVKNDDLMTLLFNFAEPPSPLSVDGLEKIVERFGSSS